MTQLGRVQGQVSAIGGADVSGSTVFVSSAMPDKQLTFTQSAPMTSTGNYVVDGVSPGRYFAFCVPSPASGLAVQTYSGIPALGALSGKYTAFTVMAQNTTKGINFALQAGGSIAVSVENTVGAPIAGATLLLLDPGTGSLLLPPLTTDADGIAVFGNVPLQMKLFAGSPDQTSGVFWRSGDTLSSGDILTISANQTTQLLVTLP
jgi:hypothetical protein